MDIQREILTVIKKQDFIILPGIGAFIFEYSKPYYNELNQLIGSKKSIRFENVITKDPDNKLTKALSESLSIPDNFAELEYQDFLRNFKKEIILKNKFDWGGFGMFFKSSNGTIEFYPEKNSIEEKKIIASTPAKPVVESVFVAPPTTPPVLPQKVKVRQEKINHPVILKNTKNSSWLKLTLFLLPLALLSYGLVNNFLKNSPSKSTEQTLVEEIDSLENVDKNFPKINDSENVLKSETKVTTKPKDKSAEVSGSNETPNHSSQEKSGNYIINIGIFKVRENVDNLATYLAENGIPAKVRPSGSKYRVYVTAENEQQAKEFVDKIEQLTGERPVYQ